MTSSYVSGVFLTVCTYDGPQLVYHYFNESLGSTHSNDRTSDGEIEWSEEESSNGEEEDHGNDMIAYDSSSPPAHSNPGVLGEDTFRSSARSRAPFSSNYSRLTLKQIHSQTVVRSRSVSPTQPQQIPQSRSISRTSPRLVAGSLSRPILQMKSSSFRCVGGSYEMFDQPYGLASNSHFPQDASEVVKVADETSGSSTSLPLASSSKNNSVTSGPLAAGIPSRISEKLQGFSSLALNSDSLATPQMVKERGADIPCGLDQDILAELLTPPESMCNEKFLVSVDDCIFVGIPVHILGSGTWRPLKPKVANAKSKPKNQSLPKSDKTTAGDTLNFGSIAESGEALASPSGTDDRNYHSLDNELRDCFDSELKFSDSKLKTESANWKGFEPSETESDTECTQAQLKANAEEVFEPKGYITERDSPMRMFHVSFVLNPPITEVDVCEERVYNNILVPFLKMLRQEQASHNYVWNEVVKMQRVHETMVNSTAVDRQEALESCSELARALRQMCEAISRMDIARILICSKARAFQIPLQLELSQLPECQDNVSPHAYLSTINSPFKEIGHNCYGCYGLLLLDDPEVIVKEIEVDPQGPVAAMIRNIDPMASLEELARQNRIELKQIVSLVWSLVYWRRARIIIPVHPRYTYGVSPLAARGEKFGELANIYHQLFPMMPPMQKIMALLSTGKPKPFSMHIPSNDHRHIYMSTVSWMLQKDLLVHLQTFALIVITRKTKISSMNMEDILESGSSTKNSDNPAKGFESNNSKVEDQHAKVKTHYVNHADIPSEQLRPRKWMIRRKSSIRIELEEIEDSMILDPRNASPQEKKWLGQVALSGLTRNPDLAAMFQRLTKYFNGFDCLEQVMIMEKITREEMRRFLHEFSMFIVTYKHW